MADIKNLHLDLNLQFPLDHAMQSKLLWIKASAK